MSRAPQLNSTVVDSLDALLAGLLPADYLGSDKEHGIRFIAALVQHYRSPTNTTKRAAAVELTRRLQKEKA